MYLMASFMARARLFVTLEAIGPTRAADVAGDAPDDLVGAAVSAWIGLVLVAITIALGG